MLNSTIQKAIRIVSRTPKKCQIPLDFIKLNSRSIHQTTCVYRFWESHPRGEYNDRNLDAEEDKKNRKNLWGLKDGLKDLRRETLKWVEESKVHLGDDSHLYIQEGDKAKMFDFKQRDSLKKWVTLSDSDYNEGFSRCEIVTSPTGRSLFEGYVNSRTSLYGQVMTAGYCTLRSNKSLKGDKKSEEDTEKIPKPKLNIKEKSKIILDDIRDTKQQMKEKVGAMMTSENVWTVPNALCFIRMGMAPVLAYMILHNQYCPAIGLFVVAGVTDLLDGYIARVVPGQASVMGSFLDPMADKILVGTLFISLTYMDLIPVPLTALIIGRDAILVMAGFYIRYQSLDPPRTLSRYFDVTHPTAQLAPTLISKVNTGVQLGLVGATLLSTILPYDAYPFLQVLWYTTAATTTISAVGYLFAKDTVKLLKHKAQNLTVKKKRKEGDK